MKVFPEFPIVFDSFAVARLIGVGKNGESVHGTFSLEPVNPTVFLDCVDAIRPVLDVKYVPFPWVWARYRLSEDEDDLLFQYGIGKIYCKAVANARRQLEKKPEAVVSGDQVKHVAESMLRWVGMR
jgi:hypothetical protein